MSEKEVIEEIKEVEEELGDVVPSTYTKIINAIIHLLFLFFRIFNQCTEDCQKTE